MIITLPEPMDLARREEMCELTGEDSESLYMPAIREAYEAIKAIRRYIVEVKELRAHQHDWSPESGFCGICGADGNA